MYERVSTPVKGPQTIVMLLSFWIPYQEKRYSIHRLCTCSEPREFRARDQSPVNSKHVFRAKLNSKPMFKAPNSKPMFTPHHARAPSVVRAQLLLLTKQEAVPQRERFRSARLAWLVTPPISPCDSKSISMRFPKEADLATAATSAYLIGLE